MPRLEWRRFGHLVRRGRLRLRRRTVSVGAFSDIDLDLRESELDTSRVTMHVFAFFGNVDVYVPEEIDVDVGGTILFGRRRDRGRGTARAAEPPTGARARRVTRTTAATDDLQVI